MPASSLLLRDARNLDVTDDNLKLQVTFFCLLKLEFLEDAKTQGFDPLFSSFPLLTQYFPLFGWDKKFIILWFYTIMDYKNDSLCLVHFLFM